MTPRASLDIKGKEQQPLETVRSSLLSPLSGVHGIDGDSSPKDPDKFGPAKRWRPFWLQARVIAGFGFMFLGCAVAISCIIAYSKQHDGLVDVHENLKYVWRFGPTAFVTIISIIWWRVELQTLRYWPWICLDRAPPNGIRGSNYLDYTSLITPNVLITAFKRHDVFVFLVVLTTVILKVQIVLSANIFQQRVVQTSQPVQARGLGLFNTTGNLSASSNAVAYFNAKAVKRFDMELPFGVSESGAYQTFDVPAQHTGARGTIEAPMVLQVDGSFVDVKCEQLESYTHALHFIGPSGIYYYTVSLKFQNCDSTVNFNLSDSSRSPSKGKQETYDNIYSVPSTTRVCPSLPPTNAQIVPYVGLFTYFDANETTLESSNFSAAICATRGYVSKVQVVDDGIRPNVTKIPSQEVTIPSDPWLMVTAGLNAAGLGTISDVVKEGSALSGRKYDQNNGSIYSSDVLQECLTSLVESMSPFIAHYLLRQDQENEIAALQIIGVGRLQANEGVCIALVLLFGAMSLMSMWFAFYSRKVSTGWKRDPATILGTMLYFLGSDYHSALIHAALASSRHAMKEEWAKSRQYAQPIIRQSSRIAFIAYAISLITALSITFRISETSQGLVTLEENTNSFWWGSLPVLAFLIIALYTSASDANIRDLAIMSKASSNSCSAKQLDMSLLDMIGFKALYHSIRLKIYSVTLSHILATACLFLTALSSVLFSATVVPLTTATEFPQASSFGSRSQTTSGDNESDVRSILDSLILTRSFSNFTYPESTYEDLVFPSLGIDGENIGWKTGMSVKANIPAAKLVPSCVRLPRDAITLVSTTTSSGTEPLFQLRAIELLKCKDGSKAQITNWMNSGMKTYRDKRTYIADILQSPDNPSLYAQYCKENQTSTSSLSEQPFRVQTYLWGNFSVGKNNAGSFDYVSMWRCNYTWAEVMTETKLTWANAHLTINNTDSPKADNSTLKPWNPPFEVPQFDRNLPASGSSSSSSKQDVFSQQIYMNNLIDNFDGQFKATIKPYGPIAVEDFQNPDKELEILDALHFNVAMASAQLVNVEQRLSVNGTSSAAPEENGELSPVQATITDEKRIRLVQNRGVTIALLVILALAAGVNIWALASTVLWRFYGKRSWLLDMELMGVAPDGFNSIAMMDAVLHDSNIQRHLPENAHLIPPCKLHEELAPFSFVMGWFGGYEEDEADLCIGILGDDQCPFLGHRHDY